MRPVVLPGETASFPYPQHVIILSGDHIYKMDYGLMLTQHLENEAALTIGAVRIPASESKRFGILQTDAEKRVLAFQEKPEIGQEIPGDPGYCLGSMGIYIFETEELIRRLRADAALKTSSHDFGNDIIPEMIGDVLVQAHAFVGLDGDKDPYWRDVGTIDAYYEANLDLCKVEPQFNLYDNDWSTYTLWHNDPPAKTVFAGDDGRKAEVVDSLLCPGVVVSGAKVRRSLLSNRVTVDEGSTLDGAVLFSGVNVGKRCKLRKVIIDKWAHIPDGTEIGYDPEADAKRFTVTESGITVVPRGYRF